MKTFNVLGDNKLGEIWLSPFQPFKFSSDSEDDAEPKNR